MRLRILNKTPSEWLTGLGFSLKKCDQILQSFEEPDSLKVYLFGAPHLFLRAHGRSSRNAIFLPNYWADGSVCGGAWNRANQFEGWLKDEEIARIAKDQFRDLTAISHNWNELKSGSFWRIALQGSETVEGIQGPVASQPAWSANPVKGETASKSTLAGGGVQVFLNPRTPFICTPFNWS